MAIDPSQVAVCSGKNIDAIVRDALGLLDGFRNRIREAESVFISPNFSIPQKSETGATTNPLVVAALIEYLKGEGCRRVIVGESAVCGLNAGAVMRALEVPEMFEKAGAAVLNLDEKGAETVTLPIPRGRLLKKIEVFKPPLDCDFLISVPVLKTHIYTQVSLGMKNLKGTLPDRQKKRFHRIGIRRKSDEPAELERCIADMMTVHHPDLTLIDATVAQEGFRPGIGIVGQPVAMDAVIAGTGFVSVDAAGAYLMGFDPLSIPHIRYCMEAGLGEADPAKIRFVGEDPETLRRNFKRAVPGELGNFKNIGIVEAEACSGCSFALRWLFDALTPEEIDAMPECTILVGAGIDAGGGKPGLRIHIGNCAANVAGGKDIVIRGCPPPFFHIRKTLREKGMLE